MKAFSWSQLDYPIIICPPMDGITDMAYRELVAEMGGAGPLYCEFVNVKGLIYENPKTIFELRFTENQFPVLAQLFGHEPDDFYEASKIAVSLGFSAIDINMGCPAHKVASKGGGCALMGDTLNAQEIIRQTIKGANEKAKQLFPDLDFEIEISCKMRLGINDKSLVYTHAPAMLEAGAKAIAIHGRTLKQMYTGEADWEPVMWMRKFIDENYKFSHPHSKPKLFGSGDVTSLYQALEKILIYGADGVMIGRGSFGNPWVFEKSAVEKLKKHIVEIQNFYNKKSGEITIDEINSYPKITAIKKELSNKQRSIQELSEMAIRHAELMVRDKGEKGIVQMRKHLGWYFNDFPGAKDLRSQLVRVNSIEEMQNILDNFQAK
jgi:nifR3 family TIM-barrel protein